MAVPVARAFFITFLLCAVVLAAPPVDDTASMPAADDSGMVAPAPSPDPTASPAVAPAPRDTTPVPLPKPVLTSIELTPEGVFGSDTLGDWWEYDFAVDRLVRGSRTRRESNRNEIARPVEERSINRLEVQRYQSSVTVGYDKFVAGNITASGRVVVKGWVRGDIQSFGQVLVEPTGQVDGDIRAPEIVVKPGGIVLGQQKISPISTDYLTWPYSFDSIWVVVGLFALLLSVAFVYIALAPRQLRNIDRCISHYRGKSFAMGALLLLLLAPGLGVLAVTIIGLILVLLVPIAYLVAMAIGIVLVGSAVAKRTIFRLSSTEPGQYLVSFVSSALAGILWLVVVLLIDSTDPLTHGLGVAVLVIAILVTLYPVCCGLGAVFLTRFGFRRYVSFRDRQASGDPGASAPAPPPIPKAPPAILPPGRKPSPRRGPSPLSSGND